MSDHVRTGTEESESAFIANWPLRPWVLAALLALAGLLIHFAWQEDVAWRMALAAFLFFSAIWAAFTIEPRRLLEPALFALGAGVVIAGIAYKTVAMDEALAGEEFAFAAGIFATVIALPLYQAGFHRTWLRTDYETTHYHVWNDAVSGAGAAAFTGLSWLMLVLLNALLDLVGLGFIEDLIEQEWFAWMWTGGAFGAALGVLRNNLKVIGALQSVVLIVLSMLAVPLAAALLVFLVALLASGGQALWDATDAATPILLACALGCFVLACAILREGDRAMTGNIVLRVAALVLALGILPLALFAAVGMGVRIDQYGLAPERLWALVAIVIATAYGLAYWVALGRGRKARWAPMLRDANLHLAAMTSLVALFLALPILDFGAISANNQVARLEAGKVAPQEFDFAALKWDFGEAGREMLARLAAGEGRVAQLAATALQQEFRPAFGDRVRVERARDPVFRIEPANPRLEPILDAYLRANPHRCIEYCVALQLQPRGENGRYRLALVESHGFDVVTLPLDDQTQAEPAGPAEPIQLERDSVVEVRSVPTEYIFIDGRRFGWPVEAADGRSPPIEVAPPAPPPPPPPPREAGPTE